MSTNHQATPEQQETPKAPVLCEMGCGFFGNDATGNCCSKCWMENMKKTQDAAVAKKNSPVAVKKQEPAVVEDDEEEPQRVVVLETPKPKAQETPDAAAVTTKKKKKKKTSYKSLMASMTTGENKERDVQKEREAIQGLGGGNFSKIEKI
jgi:hypothetical protein